MKNCFVIGPMSKEHMPHLLWLANDVVKEILNDKGFSVSTPEVQEAGNIMNYVIRSCDRAALVIADTTQNNPNVLYEIAILHAMGRACVPVKLLDESTQEEKMPFDIAAYRRFDLLKGDTKGAINKLRNVIEDVLNKEAVGDLHENPLTDFFGVPLSALASAYGVARGYFRNFILPALRGTIHDGPAWCVDRSDLDLEIIIPHKLRYATREAVDSLIKSGVIIPVTLKAPGREVKSFVWDQKITERPIMVDIPTAVGQLKGNVIARLGRATNPNPNSQAFKMLEDDELDQFSRCLRRHQDIDDDENTSLKRCSILSSLTCRKPDSFCS